MKGKLHIETKEIEGKTILKDCYFSAPFKVMDITQAKVKTKLILMLMSSSPGILDKDEFDITMQIGEKSHIELTTQAYQRIYTMKEGTFQRQKIFLEKEAFLQYLAHPIVPHKNAKFKGETAIYLDKGAKLIWSEIITCGRMGHETDFGFDYFCNLISVYYENRLLFKDNQQLFPSKVPLQTMGLYADYTHQATVLFIGEAFCSKLIRDKIAAFFEPIKELNVGISLLEKHGIVIRLLGRKAEFIYETIDLLSKEIQ
jgi:urease accessory protein